MVIVYLLCYILAYYYVKDIRLLKPLKGMMTLVPYVLLCLYSLYVNQSLLIPALGCALSYHSIHYGIKYIKHHTKDTAHSHVKIELYCLEHILQVMCIVIIASHTSSYVVSHIEQYDMIKWGLYLLIIYKPTNLTFKILFSNIRKHTKENKKETIYNTGSMIGVLERILMVILIYLGQISAIGLVLTAKSIPRYNAISNDAVFAEYYLIGTLYSMIATLAVYVFLFNII